MSSNGNVFRVTDPLCGEYPRPGEFPSQRPVTQSVDVFFDLRLDERLSKQSWSWWFETLSRSLLRQSNVLTENVSVMRKEFPFHYVIIPWDKYRIYLCPSDSISRQRSASTLAEVFACCLMIPNKCANHVKVTSVRSNGIHLRKISPEIPQSSIIKLTLKMINLKFDIIPYWLMNSILKTSIRSSVFRNVLKLTSQGVVSL